MTAKFRACNRILSTVLALSPWWAFGADYPAAVLADGPIVYYRFSDAVTYPDSVVATNLGNLGAAANGVYMGGAAPGAEAPRGPTFIGFEADNTALHLEGVAVFVSSISGLLNGKPQFTISGWVRRGADQLDRTGLFGQNDLLEFGFSDNSTLECFTDNGLDVTNAFPNGEWDYVALVSDGSPGTITMYTNGVLAGSRTH